MSTHPEAEAPATAAPGNLSPEAQRILAQAGAPAQQQPNGQARVGEPEAPKEFEVDMGNGVKRRVPVAVLEETFRQRAQIDAEKQLLEQRLADHGDLQNVKALRDRIAGLDAARRRQVLSLLDGAPEDDGVDDVDAAIVKEAFGDGARGKPADLSGWAPARLERLEQAVMALASAENSRRRDQEFQTTGQRVDALMSEFPLFRDGDQAMRAFAKDSIMSQLASAPRGTPIEDVVHRAASKLKEIQDRATAAAQEDLGVPTPSRQRLQVPEGTLTARGLKSGAIRQLATRILNGR